MSLSRLIKGGSYGKSNHLSNIYYKAKWNSNTKLSFFSFRLTSNI